MELLRSGLQLVAIKGLETCEGSVNVPVILKSDGSEYDDYTPQIHIRYLNDGKLHEEVLPSDEDGFYIPGKPFEESGPIELAVHLIRGNKQLVTNELAFIVKRAPNGTTEVDPSEYSWQQLVDAYIEQKYETIMHRLDLLTITNGNQTNLNELIDIRVGGNGITYSNAGNAVRGQYLALLKKANELTTRIDAIISSTESSLNANAEIVDARIDFEGSVKKTLGASIREADQKIMEMILTNHFKTELLSDSENGLIDENENAVLTDWAYEVDSGNVGEEWTYKVKSSETKEKEYDDNLQASTEAISQLKKDLVDHVKESQKAIEDLNDKKITKFYTNSLGEKTLNDSDNGKIQDMILYGKSLQNGTPTPDNPVEIQSVVNPKLRVCGKNLLNVKGSIYNTAPINIKVNNYNDTINPNSDTMYFGFKIYLKKGTYTLSNQGSRYISINRITDDDGIIKGSSKRLYNNPYKFTRINDGYFYFGCEIDKSADDERDVPLGNDTLDVFKLQLELGSTKTDYEPYKSEQTATLPYTLNAIPVSSGGNVKIDGKQYIADYVDIENKKLVKMVDESKLDTTVSIIDNTDLLLETPTITDLTDEEVQEFKSLHTYYPTTNIMNSSGQLDGFTTFNYPVSLKNGWEYVKQQIGDTREYIYDMELQSAEAYVNSEYAVTLTELGV